MLVAPPALESIFKNNKLFASIAGVNVDIAAVAPSLVFAPEFPVIVATTLDDTAPNVFPNSVAAAFISETLNPPVDPTTPNNSPLQPYGTTCAAKKCWSLAVIADDDCRSVSYTHLTLPTSG